MPCNTVAVFSDTVILTEESEVGYLWPWYRGTPQQKHVSISPASHFSLTPLPSSPLSLITKRMFLLFLWFTSSLYYSGPLISSPGFYINLSTGVYSSVSRYV